MVCLPKTPTTCKGWLCLTLWIAACLAILILAIMWATRSPTVVVTDPDPKKTNGSLKIIDQSLSLLHGAITGQQ